MDWAVLKELANDARTCIVQTTEPFSLLAWSGWGSEGLEVRSHSFVIGRCTTPIRANE